MSDTVKNITDNASDVAALVQATKDFRSKSLMILFVIGLSREDTVLKKAANEYNDAMSALGKALKPFGEDAG